MAEPEARIEAIYRYPVKGLSPEAMTRVGLAPHQTLPDDRLYAIENGPSGFDPAQPRYEPKIKFLMLMRNERLAALKTRFDSETHLLTVAHDGRTVASGDLGTADGRAAIEAFLATYCADQLRGPPRVLSGAGHSFSDVARKVVSIINLASVAAIADAIGRPVDPLRFRGNLYVAGWPAWHEFTLLDDKRTLVIGDVHLKPVKRIVRCAATNVDPSTGARDMQIPKAIMNLAGHADCGIYTDVVKGGTIACGDPITLA